MHRKILLWCSWYFFTLNQTALILSNFDYVAIFCIFEKILVHFFPFDRSIWWDSLLFFVGPLIFLWNWGRTLCFTSFVNLGFYIVLPKASIVFCRFFGIFLTVGLFIKYLIVIYGLSYMFYFIVFEFFYSSMNILGYLMINNQESISNVNTGLSAVPVITFHVFE